MRSAAVTVLTVIVALFVGFVLIDLVGILIWARGSGLGAGEILWRVVVVCAGLATVAALIRGGSRRER